MKKHTEEFKQEAVSPANAHYWVGSCRSAFRTCSRRLERQKLGGFETVRFLPRNPKSRYRTSSLIAYVASYVITLPSFAKLDGLERP